MEARFGKVEGKFPLGQTVSTSGAFSTLTSDDVLRGILRHSTGDWGELDDEDKAHNEKALLTGGRLVSRYSSAEGDPFYIITEWDRSLTTVLLTHDY